MEAVARHDANRTLLAALLATVGMLFAAFTAAYLERRVGSDWEAIRLPGIVWPSAFVQLLSSVALEIARRSGRRRSWIAGALGLGVLFLVGQALAWIDLTGQGVFLKTHPYASFFYMLTAVHAVHVLGGIAALGATLRKPQLLELSALYWHFVGAVWFYVLIVFSVL